MVFVVQNGGEFESGCQAWRCRTRSALLSGSVDVGIAQIHGIDWQDSDFVFCGKLLGEPLCAGAVRFRAVQDNDEGFSEILQLFNKPLFHILIISAPEIAEATVARYQDADVCVVFDDFLRADLAASSKGMFSLNQGVRTSLGVSSSFMYPLALGMM